LAFPLSGLASAFLNIYNFNMLVESENKNFGNAEMFVELTVMLIC
jgi:hypothetical protein